CRTGSVEAGDTFPAGACSCTACAVARFAPQTSFFDTEQDRDRPRRERSRLLHLEPTSATSRRVFLREPSTASQRPPTVPTSSRLPRRQDAAASWPYPEETLEENWRSVPGSSPAPEPLRYERETRQQRPAQIPVAPLA